MILEVILVTFIFINMLVIVSFFALETIQDLFKLKLTLALALSLGELGGLGIVYYFSLKSSHKIAGPIYMIERRLNEVAAGDLTVRLKLRKNDHFHDTCDVLNNCVSSLQNKVNEVKTAARAAQEQLKSGGQDGEAIAKLLATLEQFKTESDNADDADDDSAQKTA
jgi:methyl-accepting chemotaxis protein